MSTPKYVFYLIYFIFHVLLLGGTIYMMNRLGESDYGWINGFVNGDNLIFNEANITLFAVLGLILFLINVVMVNIQAGSSKKKVQKLENEVNSLKARLYDLQDAQSPGTRKSTPSSAPEDAGEDPDKPTHS